MEVKDLTGLSKPLDRLVKVIAQGVGNVFKSYLTRKNAEADAYKIRLIGSAIAETKKSLGSGEIGYKNGEVAIITGKNNNEKDYLALPERASSREEYQRQLEQFNTEQITGYAAEELTSSSDEVSEEPVDPNWVASFFASAKNVSTEEMQMLWGKILAGEVKQPGTFSLRTLDLLKNLSKSEAEVFTKFANYALIDRDKYFAMEYDEDIYGKLDITFLDLLLLKELGLIASENASLKFQIVNGTSSFMFIYGDLLITSKFPDNVSVVSLNIMPFTRIGTELASLLKINVSKEYLEKFTWKLQMQQAEVYYATITSIKGNIINYNDMHLIDKIEQP